MAMEYQDVIIIGIMILLILLIIQVTGNIVADIILRLLPSLGSVMKVGARAILSGIIGPRVEEIRDVLADYGFTLVRESEERDWYALLIQKN